MLMLLLMSMSMLMLIEQQAIEYAPFSTRRLRFLRFRKRLGPPKKTPGTPRSPNVPSTDSASYGDSVEAPPGHAAGIACGAKCIPRGPQKPIISFKERFHFHFWRTHGIPTFPRSSWRPRGLPGRAPATLRGSILSPYGPQKPLISFKEWLNSHF